MIDLIKALVQVRDALGLIAFLALVLLVAFRTKKVPELFFGLLRDKLTRQQFFDIAASFHDIELRCIPSIAAIGCALASVESPDAAQRTDCL